MGRPSIPVKIQRQVKEEAGYRCAIPSCRDKGPFDFEHIVPWSTVKRHEFFNLVLLCVSCHARVTRGEIDKSAIKTYKRNLAIITGRYSLFEMRMMEKMFEMNKAQEWKFLLFATESDAMHLKGLISDGIISCTTLRYPEGSKIGNDVKYTKDALHKPNRSEDASWNLASQIHNVPQYNIEATAKGIAFVQDYFAGKEID